MMATSLREVKRRGVLRKMTGGVAGVEGHERALNGVQRCCKGVS